MKVNRAIVLLAIPMILEMAMESLFAIVDAFFVGKVGPGALATIGRNRAVAEIFGLQVKGFAGWLLWGAAHVYFLIGFKNRLFVVLQWLWSYVTWQRGVRLIMHTDRPVEVPPLLTTRALPK